MQLLNTTEAYFNAGLQRLMDALDDVVNKVEIRSDFSIRHPDYKPLELPAEAVERFQKLSEEMQHKYLSLELRSFLYGIYYNGAMRSEMAAVHENKLPLDLENNTVLGVDVGFYQQLHDSNFGEGYFDSGWYILKQESDGSLVVTNGGLKVYINRDKHLRASESATVGDYVAIRMPKNLVQNGFYLAVGNTVSSDVQDLENQSVTVRIYFNLTPLGAVAVMGGLTQKLNEREIPFHFKVLYNPKDYQRYDSGVLYFDKNDYKVVSEVLKAIYKEHQFHFKPETPLFTLQMAPGLGLAEEPDQKFAERESFGMNRCQIVANGLLEAWYQGDNSPEGRMTSILQEFSMQAIDLESTYLNAKSEDIYQVYISEIPRPINFP
jgi:HopA1 effector protein family